MNTKLYTVKLSGYREYAESFPVDIEYDFTKFVLCPVCNERVSGGFWPPPREVVLTKQNAPDFLPGVIDTTPFVVSEKAMRAIQSAGLTGITQVDEIEHVRFLRKSKKEHPIPKYYRIELARSRITIDHDRSVIVYSPSSNRKVCSLCRQKPACYDFTRSLSFHMENYEGYDIFQTYELCSTVFLSQRFVDFYENSGLTNLRYGPAEKDGSEIAEYFLDGNEEIEII